MADSFDLLKKIGKGNSGDENLAAQENNEETPSKEVSVIEKEKETALAKDTSITEKIEEDKEEAPSDNLNIFDPRGNLGRKNYTLIIILLFTMSFNMKFLQDALNMFNTDVVYFIVDFTFLTLYIISTIKRLRDAQWPLLLAFACLLPVHFSLVFSIILMFIPPNLLSEDNI